MSRNLERRVQPETEHTILRRARSTVLRKETRRNISRNELNTNSTEVKYLKLWVETLKRAGRDLIRFCVESAVSAAVGIRVNRVKLSTASILSPSRSYTKRNETNDERRLRKTLQRRVQRARARDTDLKKCNIQPEKFRITIKKKEGSEVFVCIVCREEFDTEKGLTSHFIYHTESEISGANVGINSEENDCDFRVAKVYKCEICSGKFFTLPNYRQHMINDHGENLELLKSNCFPCSFCDKVFNKKTALIVHQRSLHDMFTQCPVCKENVKTEELFVKHVDEIHPDCTTKDKLVCGYSGGYFCKLCGISQKSFAYILSHTKKHSQSFQCDLCETKFDSKKNLNNHKLRRHGEKVFCCELCGKAFSNRESLRHHRKNHKPPEKRKRVECLKCGKTFAASNSLQVHDISAHQKERPWQCTICEKRFSCASGLHIHKTTVCEKDKASPRICPICGKSLDNYVLLGHHKANFHQFGNTEETFCHLCKKTLKDPFALYSHNRQYHMQQLTCAVCGNSRPNKGFLLEHWRKHREERPYKCSLCEITFKYATQFTQHKKAKHKNESDNPKMITDSKMNNNLKEIFNEVHAAHFLELNLSATNLESRAEDNLTDPRSVDANLGRNTDSINDSFATEERNDENGYVDFSRANNPVTLNTGLKQVSTEDPLRNCELEDDGETDDENNLGQTYSIEADFDSNDITEKEMPQKTTENISENGKSCANKTNLKNTCTKISCPDEFSEPEDDIFSPIESLSPIEHSDSELRVDKGKPLGKQDFSLVLTKTLVLKLERLKECFVCKEVFESVSSYENHLSLKSHKLSMKRSKPQVIKKDKKRRKMSKLDKKLKHSSKKTIEKNVDKFPCPFCNEIFSNAQKYKKHLLVHKKRVNCLICSEKFSTVQNLVDHYLSDHNGEKTVKCKICDKAFLSYRTSSSSYPLHRHMEFQHGEGKRQIAGHIMTFPCNICGERSENMKLYRIHLLSHNDDKHKCVYCEEEFKLPSELEVHYAETHSGNMPFPCENCSLKFPTKLRLEFHEKETHPKERPKEIVCDVCGQTFLRISDLTNHKIVHDSVEDRHKFFCEFCGKSFLRAHSLVIHRREHTGERPYPCTICGNDVAFVSSAILKEHIEKVHDGNIHHCDMCKKSFPRLKNLIKHKRRIHEKTDSIRKPFICELCPESFSKPEALKKHLELHDPARPFGCDQCSWRFKYTSNLQLHIKNVHEKLGIVYPKKNKKNSV